MCAACDVFLKFDIRMSLYRALFANIYDGSRVFSNQPMMGGRHATCAYWVDYTQAHVVQ